jgi:hypothetical protein
VLSKLIGQGFEELMVEPVFRFFDAYKRRWGGVFQQQL